LRISGFARARLHPSPRCAMSLNPVQLRYFVMVAEEGQITRAARKLDVAQPALSQGIANLEAELGFKLFERRPRGVVLTSAGEAFLASAQTALSSEREAESTARSLARIGKGTLKMGFLSTPPLVFAPHLFNAFKEAYPHLELSFRELPFPSRSARDWLSEVDLALCFSPPVESDIESRVLWSEPRFLMIPRDHRLASMEKLELINVLDECYYGCHPLVDSTWAGFWTLDDHRGRPPVQLTNDRPTNSLELIATISSCRAIRAFSATTAQTLERFLHELIALPLADARPTECALVWRKSSNNPLVTAFVEVAEAVDANI
jgi:DNA-binding transcriptional LysR family regulator